MNDKDIDLIKEFERLLSEGGVDVSGAQPTVELEPRYNCDRGFHKWKWYVGAHIEQYYYCELCDLKDKTRFPPTSRS